MGRFLVVCIVLFACSCGRKNEDPHGSDSPDAGKPQVAPPQTVESETQELAQRVCASLESCDAPTLVSEKECVKQYIKSIPGDGLDCARCTAEITCQGWEALFDEEVVLCDVCPDCSCENDDDDALVDQEIPCTPGMTSTALIGMAGLDPCPQDAMGCPSSCIPGTMISSSTPGVAVPCPASGGFVAVTQCGADMRWAKTCQCMPKGGTGGTTMPICGNNIKEGNEQCDGPLPADINCTRMMGAGATGTITCSATCQLQISCMRAP